MKALHSLFLLTLLCGLTGFAKADPIDFRMNVLDPPGGTFHINNLSPVTISFSSCTGQLPPNVAPPGNGGCFSAENDTGQSLTQLDFVFPVAGVIANQTANCTPYAFTGSSNPNIFGTATCGFSPNHVNFVLVFTNGAITNGEDFVVTEDGAAAAQFPDGKLSFMPSIPEPSSIVLLSTGILMVGFLCARERGLSSQPRGISAHDR